MIQFPDSISISAGSTSPLVFGQIDEAGVTEAGGPSAGVIAQLGFGPAAANPTNQPGWTWAPASFNVQVGNNDEYLATFKPASPGDYRYAYRFSLDGGASWTYCDSHQGDGGAGSNGGLTFEAQNLGVLTVTP